MANVLTLIQRALHRPDLAITSSSNEPGPPESIDSPQCRAFIMRHAPWLDSLFTDWNAFDEVRSHHWRNAIDVSGRGLMVKGMPLEELGLAMDEVIETFPGEIEERYQCCLCLNGGGLCGDSQGQLRAFFNWNSGREAELEAVLTELRTLFASRVELNRSTATRRAELEEATTAWLSDFQLDRHVRQFLRAQGGHVIDVRGLALRRPNGREIDTLGVMLRGEQLWVVAGESMIIQADPGRCIVSEFLKVNGDRLEVLGTALEQLKRDLDATGFNSARASHCAARPDFEI